MGAVVPVPLLSYVPATDRVLAECKEDMADPVRDQSGHGPQLKVPIWYVPTWRELWPSHGVQCLNVGLKVT